RRVLFRSPGRGRRLEARRRALRRGGPIARRAAPQPAADAAEEAGLTLQVVADDVLGPAGAQRVRHRAQIAQEPVVDGDVGAARRRRIEGDPAAPRQPRLDPAVGVALAERVVAAVGVEAPAEEARDVARGDAERAQLDRERGREVLAVTAPGFEEEDVERSAAVQPWSLERVAVLTGVA